MVTPPPATLKHRLSFKTKHVFTKHTGGGRDGTTVQKANVKQRQTGAGSAACPAETAAISGSLLGPWGLIPGVLLLRTHPALLLCLSVPPEKKITTVLKINKNKQEKKRLLWEIACSVLVTSAPIHGESLL